MADNGIATVQESVRGVYGKSHGGDCHCEVLCMVMECESFVHLNTLFDSSAKCS